MKIDYWWNPSVGAWVVVECASNQILSVHWHKYDAINFIITLKLRKSRLPIPPVGGVANHFK